MLTIIKWLVYGCCALPAVATRAPLPKNCRNTPTSRGCWRDGFDILTDYNNNSLVPPGKLVEYNLTVGQQVISPDGYKKLGMVANGQFPGPTIEADWGDTLRISVHNNFTDNHNGSSIHWHGLRQFETNHQDGVPGVTQCPSKPGETQVYEFRAMQYGTSWYHSHFSLQYSNGLFGPIVVHGPSSMDWDEDLGPWLLHDWYHDDVFSLLWVGETKSRGAIPETTIFNGKGKFDCNPNNDTQCTGTGGDYFEVSFRKGVKYKLAIVNTGTLLEYQFWIDGHNLTVIAADFVPIEPYVTDVVNVAMGQRYEIIVEANADFTHGSNFWIYAQYCGEVDLLPHKAVGIVRYDEKDRRDPWTRPLSEQHQDFGCADPNPDDLVPVVQQTVGRRVNSMQMKDYLRLGQEGYPDPMNFDGGLHKWVLGDVPMFVDWKDPSLKKLAVDGHPDFPPETVPIMLDFETGAWVHFVITNNYTWDKVHFPRNLTPIMHPMHLHGHDFAILAQGRGEFNPDIVPKLDNPARRDVVNVDTGSYVWIAFQVNNPGAWLLHCHVAFHVSSGLSLQFIEQPRKIKPLMKAAGVLGEFQDRCAAWSRYYDGVNIPDNNTVDDSGI